MICPNCGKETEGSFCANCGAGMQNNQAPGNPQTQPAPDQPQYQQAPPQQQPPQQAYPNQQQQYQQPVYSQIPPNAIKVCPHCGNVASAYAVQCPRCGVDIAALPYQMPQPVQPIQPQPYQEPVAVQNRSGLVCPHCHSQNISVQAVAELKKNGCGMILLYILLACTVIGLFLLIPIMRGQKSKTQSYAVCQSCGHRWKI